MIEQQLDKRQFSESKKTEEDVMIIDLMDIFRKIIGIRRILYKAAAVGLVIGIIVTLSIPKKYTVRVTLSPEVGNSRGSNGLTGLAASFLGSGTTVGDASDALNVSLSADIVSSTPFLLELLNMEVTSSNKEAKVTLKSYLDEQTSPWWSYIIAFPNIIIGGVKSFFVDKDILINKMPQGIIELTKEESEKTNFLKNNIIVSIDKKTAVTSISVTLQNPKVAASVADSVVRKLQEYIIAYRTSKAKDDCIYLEKLYKERQQEYYIAQKKYAEYVDTHGNLILQSIRAEQERLQNDMNLAYQVYSQVANQLQVARAKVQEEKPVFAVVEPAVIPLKPSGLGLKIYVPLCVFFVLFVTMSWLLVGKNLLGKLNK